MNESFSQSSTRVQIWETAFAGINKSPIIGYGMWGDRPIVNGFVHNIFIEFLCSYGYFFGSLLFVILVGFICKSVFRKHYDTLIHEMILVSIPAGFINLLFSGSYLTNIWFFFLVGLLIKYHLEERMIDRENEGGLI